MLRLARLIQSKESVRSRSAAAIAERVETLGHYEVLAYHEARAKNILGTRLVPINVTFLRGVQKTDGDGVVQFKRIFPGHYSGRATHQHMIAYQNAIILANGTLDAGSYAHVGKLFWDQDLITNVEATYPYYANTVASAENDVDHVFTGYVETSDPILEYVYLGDTLADGLFGWITITVNTSASYDPSYSFAYTADGGVAESGGSDSVTSMGGGNGTNNTAPDGAASSGMVKLV